uniref:FMN hydroxy acid dehydrogenase domain-containing protein n=1 Tax=Pristionchus pacificus TaxID=54126 RepID=A0A2A6CRK2_PRIPA|eukprot:PDM80769.1 hypothetical protein PRIPAC_35772 [Pristionchus pacificus]
MYRDRELLTVTDYECAAIQALSDADYGHYSGGADDEVTLGENTRAFNDYMIRSHCLRDVASLSTSTSFLTHSLSHPIGVAPTAFHGLAHEQGELATVRGARAASSLMISSSWATTSLEDMKKEAGENPMWMQLFVYTDRELTQSIVRRAEAAGYSALVLTVDYPARGNRLADKRNGFELPEHLKSTTLPVIVKGVLRADDALEALRCGVKGIIVSNHGGRQLDSAPASIHALREVVEAVHEGKHRLFRVPVWMDGGIRNGRDIFKALAMGATGVFVGRPVIWGLAAHGECGVAHVLNILKEELEQTMKLAGCPTIESIRAANDIVVHKTFYERR